MVIASVAFLPAAWAAVTDVRARRIPDRIVAACLTPPLVVVLAAALDGRLGAAQRVGSGVLLLGVPVLLVHLALPATIGFGDVKLAVALGAVVGVVEPRLALVALALASGGTLLVAAPLRRRSLPFAPGLVLAAAVVLLAHAMLSPEVIAWR